VELDPGQRDPAPESDDVKQVVQNLRGEVRLLDLPVPALLDGGVLVRTVCSVVSSGTERMNVERSRRSLIGRARQRPDLVRQVLARLKRDGLLVTARSVTDKLESWIAMGYSSAGIVEAVGRGVDGLQVGDRVACAGGGYASHAELVWVPKHLCARLPDATASAPEVALQDAAFATLGAIALQGVRQADPRLGETVAVIGLGLLGLLTVQILRANGCQVIACDPDPERCRLAERLGALEATAPGRGFAQAAAHRTGHHGTDAVIIAAASDSRDPIELAGEICRERGRVVILGAVPVDVPRSPYYEKELEVRFSRSYGPGRYDPVYEEAGHDYPIGYVRWTEQRNLEAFLGLLASRSVEVAPLVTHRYSITEAPQAYELLTTRREPCLAIVLEYPAEPARTTRLMPAAARPVVGTLGVGFVGAGSFARSVLLPAIQAVPGVRLRGVAAATGLTVTTVSQRAGFAFGSTDVAEVINDGETHAVFIATRHHLHADQVIAALAAGKHVFVEKPVCIVEPDLDRILEALHAAEAKHGPRVLMVGFNRRFAPQVQRIQRLFTKRSTPLQLHYRVNAGYVPSGSWVHDPVVGGGRVIGEGCHFFDLAGALVGSRPMRVTAEASSADSISALVKYVDGSVANIDYFSSGHPAVSKERLEVVAEGAVAQLDDYRTLTWHTPDGQGKQNLKLPDKGHREEVTAFLDAVRSGGPAPIPPAQFIDSMRVTFRALDAAAVGTGLLVDQPSGYA